MSKLLFALLFLSVYLCSTASELRASNDENSYTIQSVVSTNTIEPQVKQSKRAYSIGIAYAMGPENILTFFFPKK